MIACWCSRTWRAPQPVVPAGHDFRETVRLDWAGWHVVVAENGRFPPLVSQPTPTYAWTRDQFADSQLLIEPIPGTPPGLYTIQLRLV